MKRSLPVWQMWGFLFTAAAGTLLHFLYDWTKAIPVAMISAVNESIWEHMKLLYMPMLLFALVQRRHFREEGFWQSKLLGFLLGLGLIPVTYYTYTGSLGVSADWFNITIFFLAAAAVFRTETWLMRRKKRWRFSGRVALALVLLLGALFVIFTFLPPRIPLFRDPVSGGYGIPG
jgi:hypothetical protein